MESTAGDPEQLRSSLHCDDKDKLRRKLLLLQREYLRTAQRLQRAECSEGVRGHVRSRITQQHNQQAQGDSEVTPGVNPSLLTQTAADGTATDVPQCKGHSGDVLPGPTESDTSRRSQVISLLLHSEAGGQPATDPVLDTARGHRPSPALRLRSRRSRLRWEKSCAEAGRSADSNEEGREQRERMETVKVQRSDEGVKTEATEVVNESEELCSGAESESPSLLLTHWNTCGQNYKGDVEGQDRQGGQKQRDKETELTDEGKEESLLLTCCNPPIDNKGGEQDGTQNVRQEREESCDSRGQMDGRLCEDTNIERIKCEKNHDSGAEIKEDKSEVVEGDHRVQGTGLLDSCTLVEGLLFPVEYYVRTTRRMTLSQSQPDMQAVLLSQLSVGRPRRSRGHRGRRNGPARNHECSNQHSRAGFSTEMTESACAGLHVESQDADTSAELNAQSSGENSVQISACQMETPAPAVSTHCPVRGRRRRRGRGRGRPQRPRRSFSSDACQIGLEQALPASSPVSSSLSFYGADAPKPSRTPGEAGPESDDPQRVSTLSTAAQPSLGGNGTEDSAAFAHQVYPIILKSQRGTNRATQMSRSPASWRSLLLPSPQPAITPLPAPPSLSLSLLVKKCIKSDIPQDFHLPDDQFASLKLHKLCEVAAEMGVEHFTSPSYCTRRSIRLCESFNSSSDLLPLSLPSTISDSPHPTDTRRISTQSEELKNMKVDHTFTGTLLSQSLREELSDRENPAEQKNENLHSTSTEPVSEVLERPADCVTQCKEEHTVIHSSHSDQCVTARLHIPSADGPTGEENDYNVSQSDEVNIKVFSSEEQTNCHVSTNHRTEANAAIKTPLSFDCPPQRQPEAPSDACTAAHACRGTEAPGESPVPHLNVKPPAKESEKSPESRTAPPKSQCFPHHSLQSHLLLSPPPASAPLTSPHLRSSATPSSSILPSLGLTPHTNPLTCSPSAPALALPPPHSPSTQALSPPPLSPCPFLTSLPPSQVSCGSSQGAEPAAGPTVSRMQAEGPDGPAGLTTAEGHMLRCTHTLKSPAGGSLVDACCLPGSSGGLCVAAAGKWAVCLWSQTSASDWDLLHTWSFSKPVISVFPVPDAAGLICVTLGQLEIREVRTLSCCSFSQVLLCEGLVQAAVGVSHSRVITSSPSASGSALQLFTLADSGSTLSSQSLVTPGVCVAALAPVDGLSDALIGTDEGGLLFIWNLKSGQLLQKIFLGDGSHTACLRGYSYCGVLFVLLQHQLLSSLEEERREAAEKDEGFLEEEEDKRKRAALLSLVAVNPLSGKSVTATQLYPPTFWSGRLCEADVDECSVVGLSQSGCVCVWTLERQGTTTMVTTPESEGWQLARWGGGGTLVTGHHNGDVTLHCYRTSQSSLCH